jgi:hypothetical protein
MAETVEHAEVGEHAAADDDILEKAWRNVGKGAGSWTWCLRAGRTGRKSQCQRGNEKRGSEEHACAPKTMRMS